MNSKTEVCNYALVVHLGADSIDDFDSDNSKNGRQCRRVYSHLLQQLFEEHPWQFAEKSAILNLTTDDPLEWQYAYQFPGDCAMIREIYRSQKSSLPINYDVLLNSTGDGKIICCNEETAYAFYTKFLENVSVWPAYFIDAMSFRLARALCSTVNASEKKKENIAVEETGMVSRAKSNDAQFMKKDTTEPDCEFIEARQ